MKRILLVDDDAASCEAATNILLELECAVETVTDGLPGANVFTRIVAGRTRVFGGIGFSVAVTLDEAST